MLDCLYCFNTVLFVGCREGHLPSETYDIAEAIVLTARTDIEPMVSKQWRHKTTLIVCHKKGSKRQTYR